MKALLLSSLFSASLSAAWFSAGVKGGVPLDRAGRPDDGRTRVDRQRWVVGPAVEAGLTTRFSFGAEALYRRLGYETEGSAGGALFFERARTSHWEVPIYAKYRVGTGGVRPFVLGGAAYEHAAVSGTGGCTGDRAICGPSFGTFDLKSSSDGGGWLWGAGAEWRVGKLYASAEFRYTRWVRGYFSGAGPNQPAILLGIRF